MSEGNTCYYEFGDYRLDFINYRLLKNDCPVQLTQKSLKILHTLIENRDRVVRKEELLNQIWDDCYVEDATLTQHIYMLRKSLKQNGSGANLIETVPKLGYRFTAEVREIFNENKNHKTAADFGIAEVVNSEILPSGENDHPEYESRFFSEYDQRKYSKENSFSKKAVLFASVFGVLAFYIGLSVYLSVNSSQKKSASDTEQIKSIAVLPFKQIAEEKDEKLGVGMADVLISKLGGGGNNLRVLPTGSIIRYSEEDLSNLAGIGRELGVNSVLTGTIQREGKDIRVTAQLYDVEEQRSLWSGKFDEEFSNIFSVQDAISEQITRELTGKFQNGNPSMPGENYTKNVEAHQAYSMGLFHWNKRTDDGLKKAIENFQTAIEKDPAFVLAYAYLADSYTLAAYYKFDFISQKQAREQATAAANKALELDPNCSEAMTALAVNLLGRENSGKSFELLKKAIEIKPNNATAHQRIAWQYAGKGDIEKALLEMQTAQNLDPQARNTNIGLATILNYARRPDDSMIYSRRVLELDPTNMMAKFSLAESLEQKGNFEEAQRLVGDVPQSNKFHKNARAMLSRIYAKTDHQTEAEKIIKELENDKSADEMAYEIAQTYAALGNRRAAIKWLEKSVSDGGLIYFYIRHDYNLDNLRKAGNLDKYSG